MTFITITRLWNSQHGTQETHTDEFYVNPEAIATIRPIDVVVRMPDSEPERIVGAEVILVTKAAYTVLESADQVRQMAENATTFNEFG